ncbi:MAG TPA: ATP-binding cassette domain-containing protein, partial [Anaerolineae bacterium]
QLVDLKQHAQQKLNQLTRGMRKRLGLARALSNDAQLLLLDEPFSDIDPRAHIEIRELLKELHLMGKTLLITAGTPADFAGICTDLAVLNLGKLVLSGTAKVVLNRMNIQRIINVKFFGNVDTAVTITRRSAGVEYCEIVSDGSSSTNAANDEMKSLPAIVTVLKELRIGFVGSYDEASSLLRLLMRSGVQVVSFGETAADVATPIEQTLLNGEPAQAG